MAVFLTCRRLMAVNSLLAKITFTKKTCQLDAPNFHTNFNLLPSQWFPSDSLQRGTGVSRRVWRTTQKFWRREHWKRGICINISDVYFQNSRQICDNFAHPSLESDVRNEVYRHFAQVWRAICATPPFSAVSKGVVVRGGDPNNCQFGIARALVAIINFASSPCENL